MRPMIPLFSHRILTSFTMWRRKWRVPATAMSQACEKLASMWKYPAGLINARALDPLVLKRAWVEASDEAESKISQLADCQLDLPIGVAFVDSAGRPGWIGEDASLRI